MKLYLVRHGDSTPALDDDKRPLSEKGTKDITRLAKFISPLNITVSRIIHSKKFRAKQTADILSASIATKLPGQARAELDPMNSIIPIIDEIYAQDEDLMLVGHMPFMGKLAARLITGDENKDIVAFKTGCMICLERMAANSWIINWVLYPELCRVD